MAMRAVMTRSAATPRAWSKERASETASAYVPLSFAPGEAYQFDWSHDIVVMDRVTTTVKVAHVQSLPQPHDAGARLSSEWERKKEMVFDAHERAFAFFRGPLLARHLRQYEDGGGDDLHRQGSAIQSPAFPAQMCSHHLVEPVACTPASGWERIPRSCPAVSGERAAIARALAMDPKAMLFDEVTSALAQRNAKGGEPPDFMCTLFPPLRRSTRLPKSTRIKSVESSFDEVRIRAERRVRRAYKCAEGEHRVGEGGRLCGRGHQIYSGPNSRLPVRRATTLLKVIEIVAEPPSGRITATRHGSISIMLTTLSGLIAIR